MARAVSGVGPSGALWTDDWKQSVQRAKDRLDSGASTLEHIRPLIKDSWLRSRERVNPSTTEPGSVWNRADLVEYRNAHPLARVFPIVQRLLLRYTIDQGLIVALGDASGRLLWVDGDDSAIRRADQMGFVEGADWSEESMGTSAPGTALWVGHSVQVRALEHFSHIVEPWSCSAIPVRDPRTQSVVGVLDITGGDDAVQPATIPLLEATVAAMEAELTLAEHKAPPSGRIVHLEVSTPAVLRTLGRDLAQLESPRHPALTLSQKHSEILTLLACHPAGLSAESLSALVYGEGRPVTTIRAEVSRLKTVLSHAQSDLEIHSRPYRLSGPVETDIHRLKAFVSRGAHRVALAKYAGPVLPDSHAPGIEKLREDTHLLLREALMQEASIDVLLDYAHLDDCRFDEQLWRMCLELLPPKSPRRAEVLLRLEAIEAWCNDLQPSDS